ncbi:MAG: tRNA adenosine(34) deaminase TadA [Legionellales bacterium]|nr:tRNA adenosine(34) deaminase TadA [Legionellales bacterium]
MSCVLDDSVFMAEALALAKYAQEQGEIPVGAVIVYQGEIIARGWNQPILRHDPTAHAEIMAIREAGEKLGNYRLVDTTLYVTLEPCSMCAGAMVHARIKRLVYGASDPRTGAAGSVFNLADSPLLNHRLSIEKGVLADPCRELLQAFFAGKRRLYPKRFIFRGL